MIQQSGCLVQFFINSNTSQFENKISKWISYNHTKTNNKGTELSKQFFPKYQKLSQNHHIIVLNTINFIFKSVKQFKMHKWQFGIAFAHNFHQKYKIMLFKINRL